MKTAFLYFALFVGQIYTLQDRPIVHLPADQNSIRNEFGGSMVELLNSPSVIQLPKQPPTLDSRGKPWSVDIKNIGPNPVTVVGRAQFSVAVPVGRVVHIKFAASGYSSSQ